MEFDGHKTLMARVGSHQRAIYRPVITDPAIRHGPLHRVIKKCLEDIRVVEAVLAVLGKCRIVPHP